MTYVVPPPRFESDRKKKCHDQSSAQTSARHRLASQPTPAQTSRDRVVDPAHRESGKSRSAGRDADPVARMARSRVPESGEPGDRGPR